MQVVDIRLTRLVQVGIWCAPCRCYRLGASPANAQDSQQTRALSLRGGRGALLLGLGLGLTCLCAYSTADWTGLHCNDD
jgi:hypothetical protein